MSDTPVIDIPPGHRLLADDEVVASGDLYIRGDLTEGWRVASGSLGQQVSKWRSVLGLPDIYWVRKVDIPTPTQDKEWMNPWD